MSKKVVVIGAGFAGMSAATYLAINGFEVTIFDKLQKVGGRAQVLKHKGFTFDMGPSWYWMPDVFDNYFSEFGFTVHELYQLKRMDTSYRVFFGKDDVVDIASDWQKIETVFDEIEPGSAVKLNAFINDAQQKYEIAMKGYIEKPGLSPFEFINLDGLRGMLKLDLLKSVKTLVHKYFQHPKLRAILEFPVLFLGAMPKNIPALYTLMNYADLKLGTWYPMGGMGTVAHAMQKVAEIKGVKFELGKTIEHIEVVDKKVIGVKLDNELFKADIVVGAGDYQHIDQHLLPKKFHNYSEKYWDTRIMAPSALLFYIGLNKKIARLEHHNLFFDEDFEVHGHEIYTSPQLPTRPQMYVSVTSRTDSSVAPENCDALVGLIPVAVDLEDTEEIRKEYGKRLINKIEYLTGESIAPHVLFMKTYAHNDFIADYNAFKGNAYGLANTLKQTAFLKPKIKNAKLPNLFYAGQLTVPGPGVPPAIISGKIVAKEISKRFK